MARGLSKEEEFFRRVESLALSALPTQELLAGSYQSGRHSGVMVALVPDDPASLEIDGDTALPSEELHVTLCFLGKVQNLSAIDKSSILARTRSVCNEVGHAFSTTADGVVVMGQDENGTPATAILVQSDDIVRLYDALSDALDYQSKFSSFIPHMTIGYGLPVDDVQQMVGQEISFSSVVVKFGEESHLIPLAASIVAAPRGANVIDRVIDSLGRLWDEALHPRGSDGRFIKKNGAVSGKLSVSSPGGRGVTSVDANRASVIGFHTFGNDVWVLAEVVNPDGSKVQGFAKADEVRAVAPVKARLDALYPVQEGAPDFNQASLERHRQLDLILAAINEQFGAENDRDGADAFLETLGLRDGDYDYIYEGDDPDFLGGIRKIDRQLTPDEVDEQEDIINDAKEVKELRDRVHGMANDSSDTEISSDNAVDALKGGADPLAVPSATLFDDMVASGRFTLTTSGAETGISTIHWFEDDSDPTGNNVYLAGLQRQTPNRAYFVKDSALGAEFDNSDIAREVLTSLLNEQVIEDSGSGDRALLMPKSVFADNPVWDGVSPEEDFDDLFRRKIHQPGRVLSSHAEYLVPSDWRITTEAIEHSKLMNDLKTVTDPSINDDIIAGYNEDRGNIFGNSVAKMILFDYVIQNGDRNANNAILAAPPDGSEGKVILFDHGNAYDNPPVDRKTGEALEITDPEGMFSWLMNYPYARGWLNMVRGGLNLNENVTEASLRSAIADFSDAYGNIDADKILERFRAIPGVTDAQIARVEAELPGVIERINWIANNVDAVYNGLVGGGPVV